MLSSGGKSAMARCRTAALGGHLDECARCGYRAISYNSCRNRHCPTWQTGARDRGLEKRRQELLPTCYVHVVFTLPRELAPLALQNKKVIFDLLFRASAEPFSKSLAIPNISAHRSASSAYCTLGIKSSNFTRMSIAWSLLADSPLITPTGSKLATPSFYPSRCSVASFVASLLRLSSAPFATADCDSMET
jgi:Transposase zinc-binding domain